MADRHSFLRGTRNDVRVGGAAFLLLGCLAVTASAITWDGGAGDDNWGSATNWDTDTAPTFPAALVFGGSARLTPTNDYTDATVTNLLFAAGAGAFTLWGNPVTLKGNVSVAVANGSPTNNQTINLPIVLGTNAVFTPAFTRGDYAPEKGALILNGPISGPFGLSAGGKNFVQFNGTNTYTGDTVLNASSSDLSMAIGSDYAFGSGLVKFGSYVGAGQQWIVSSGDHTITNNVDIMTQLFIAQNTTVGGKASGCLTLGGNILVHASSGFFMNADVRAAVWKTQPLGQQHLYQHDHAHNARLWIGSRAEHQFGRIAGLHQQRRPV
jgi:hypothetical protein